MKQSLDFEKFLVTHTLLGNVLKLCSYLVDFSYRQSPEHLFSFVHKKTLNHSSTAQYFDVANYCRKSEYTYLCATRNIAFRSTIIVSKEDRDI